MKDYSERLVTFNQVSPTFFIGLGGSGSDVVNRVAQKLKARWNWHSLSQLIHFFAVDTNTHDLAKQDAVPRENRILISDFDKRAYIEQKRGEGFQSSDPYVTQWVHDWYQFRGTRGAGAGQIRIESRLSLYYQLEQDRGRIIQRLTTAMNTARHHDNPYRKNEPPHFNVFIYGSIAGGTGSGSFIPMAYLLKELVRQQGWIPKVWGTLIMPSLFLNDVPGALHRDINANGYAALKELEHLMKLGAEGSSTAEEFHYNPNNPHEPHVRDKPYDFLYLADKPTTLHVAEYKNAIADAAYLLLYSPILGAQASDYDNYEKHQKGLVSGYTVYYGSNGCALLILPDTDILEYCALKYAARAMADYLLFQKGASGGADFGINFNDPKFQRLSRQGQAEAIDEKFCQFIEFEARREVDDEITDGPYQAVATLRTPTGSDLLTEFQTVIDGFGAQCGEAIDLHTVRATDIVEENIKVDNELGDLRNEVNASRARVRGLWDVARQELRSGLVMRDFFAKHQANPYAQRFFLIRVKGRLRQQIDELTAKLTQVAEVANLDSDAVANEVKSWRDKLHESAPYTFKEKLKRQGNADFDHAKNGFVQYFNGTLVDGARAHIVDDFKIQWLREALEHCEQRLEAFRAVSIQAAEAIASVDKEAEDARLTGRFAHGDGRSNAFTLDVEALQEVGGERLWHLYFQDRFVDGGREFATFDEQKIFAIITDAFNPKIEPDGRRSAKGAREITDEIKAGLVELGREALRPQIVGSRTGGDDLTQKGLLLDDALFYEARYHFRRQYAADGSNQEPTQQQLEGYIKSKLKFCENKSQPMATFGDVEDQRVIASTGTLVGCHRAYRERLEPLIEEVTPEGRRIANWEDEKAIAFYRANLGIPLYFYQRVNTEMKRDYDLCMAKPPAERGYPLHIESSWEDDLDNLDPHEHKKRAEGEGRREQHIDYALGFATGLLRVHDDGAIHWHIAQFDELLGKNHREAFEALGKLEERTRRRIEAALTATRRELSDGTNPNLLGQIDGHLSDLDETVWALEQRKDPAQKTLLDFVKEHEEVVKRWRASLG